MGNSAGLLVREAERQRCGLQGNWGGSEAAPLVICPSTSYFCPSSYLCSPVSPSAQTGNGGPPWGLASCSQPLGPNRPAEALASISGLELS